MAMAAAPLPGMPHRADEPGFILAAGYALLDLIIILARKDKSVPF
jgi:hypothetical protein